MSVQDTIDPRIDVTWITCCIERPVNMMAVFRENNGMIFSLNWASARTVMYRIITIATCAPNNIT